MSWDIFVQDLPPQARFVADIPEGFEPAPLGRRSDVILRISELLPHSDFRDPSWGVVEGPGYSIDISLGGEETLRGFAFHVSGSSDAAARVVISILAHLGMRAIDMSSEIILGAGSDAQEGFRRWKEYRDRMTGDGPSAGS